MKLLLVLVSSLVVFTLPTQAAEPDCSAYVQEEKLVDSYFRGIANEETFKPYFEVMQELPKGVSCHLVKSLHVIEKDKLNGNQATDVRPIWALRALRFLNSCQNFTSTLKGEDLSQASAHRRYWLLHNGDDNIPYFATWMSRDMSYLAPVDVQKRVIKKWQNWYAELDNDDDEYEICPSLNDWYF